MGRDHTHPFPQIVIILQGSAVQSLADKIYPLRPGMVFYFGAFEPHATDSPSVGPHAHLRVNLVRGRLFSHVFSSESNHASHTTLMEDVFDARQLGIPVEQHWAELAAHPEVPPEIARVRLLSATALMASALLTREALSSSPLRTMPTAEVIEAICAHLRETGGSGATLADMASVAGYSRFHFARLFKRHAGVSVHRYIDTCRAGRAAELTAKGMSPTKVAAALGFSSLAIYSRWQRIRRSREAG